MLVQSKVLTVQYCFWQNSFPLRLSKMPSLQHQTHRFPYGLIKALALQVTSRVIWCKTAGGNSTFVLVVFKFSADK